MAPKRKPLLDIGGITPPRHTILIRTTNDPDGTIYELRNGLELSPQEFAEIGRMGEAVNALDDAEESAANIGLLGNYLDRLLEIAIPKTTPLTDEAREELSIDDKVSIITAFTEHCLAGVPEPTVQKPNRATRRATTKKSTGAK